MKNFFLLAAFAAMLSIYAFSSASEPIYFVETVTYQDGSTEIVEHTYNQYEEIFMHKTAEEVSEHRMAYFGEDMVAYYGCSIQASDGQCLVNCCSPQCFQAHWLCMCNLPGAPSGCTIEEGPTH